MNLNNAARTTIRRNARWLLRLTALGILTPVAAIIIPKCRDILVKRHRLDGVFFLGVFAACVLIGFNLRR